MRQDIAALCRAVKQTNPDIIFHCDASQSVGKMAVDVKAMGIDMLTLAAHKLYATFAARDCANDSALPFPISGSVCLHMWKYVRMTLQMFCGC
jgi:selenocysteine lyase/cysteine desulfurase